MLVTSLVTRLVMLRCLLSYQVLPLSLDHYPTPGVSTASWEVTGVLFRGGVIKLPRALSAGFQPAAGAKILAILLLTVNHYTFRP